MRCESKANINFQGDSHRSFDKNQKKFLEGERRLWFENGENGIFHKIVDKVEKILYNFAV